jgi:hypothetical protein
MNITNFAQAADDVINRRENCQGDKCLSVLPEVSAVRSQLQSGLAVIFGVMAAIAVLIIILAAINMATADGNPENISKSKKTIIYALIGLVIALSAEAIVLTVLGRL